MMTEAHDTLKFSYVRAFKAIYELGTVTAAADYLHVTQPAISRLLSLLEEELGFKLFDRIRGRLKPTERGRLFYQEVSRIFIGLDQLMQKARTIRDGNGTGLSIVAMPLLSNLFLPQLMAKLRGEVPDCRLTLHTYRSDEVAERVAIQSCDLGFSLTPSVSRNVSCYRFSSPIIVLLPPGTDILKNPLNIQDLSQMSLIRTERDLSQRQVDNLILSLASGPEAGDTGIEVSLGSSLAALVGLGQGAAITDLFTAAIARSFHGNVIERQLSPPLAFDFYLLLPRLRSMPTLARRLLALMKEEASVQGFTFEVNRLSEDGRLYHLGSNWLHEIMQAV